MQIHSLVQDVRDQLDEPDSSYLTHETIMRWLNQGQRLIARLTKCLKDEETIILTANMFEFPLPDNYGVEAVAYSEDSSFYLPLRNLSESEALRRHMISQSGGTPEYYLLARKGKESHIIIMPPPSKTSYLKVFLYKVPETMICQTDAQGNPIYDNTNVDPEIPEEFQDILVSWCRYKKLARQEDKDYRLARQEFYEETYLARDSVFLESGRFEDEMYIDYR